MISSGEVAAYFTGWYFRKSKLSIADLPEWSYALGVLTRWSTLSIIRVFSIREPILVHRGVPLHLAPTFINFDCRNFWPLSIELSAHCSLKSMKILSLITMNTKRSDSYFNGTRTLKNLLSDFASEVFSKTIGWLPVFVEHF